MLIRAIHQPLVNFREHQDDLVLLLIINRFIIHDGLVELVMQVSHGKTQV